MLMAFGLSYLRLLKAINLIVLNISGYACHHYTLDVEMCFEPYKQV